MREYGKISPRFWIGATGRKIRALGAEAQVLALYLLTCPAASMTGLFYVSRPTMEHETGLSAGDVTTCLADLSLVGFAQYDAESETVWVPEMARHQVGERLMTKDKRHPAMIKELRQHTGHRFLLAFWERYRLAYELPSGSPFLADAVQQEAPSGPQEGTLERAGAGAGAREGARARANAAPPPPPTVSPPDPPAVDCPTIDYAGRPSAHDVVQEFCDAAAGKVQWQADAQTTRRFVNAAWDMRLTVPQLRLCGAFLAAGGLSHIRRKVYDLGMFAPHDGHSGLAIKLPELFAKATEWDGNERPRTAPQADLLPPIGTGELARIRAAKAAAEATKATGTNG